MRDREARSMARTARAARRGIGTRADPVPPPAPPDPAGTDPKAALHFG